MSYYPLHASWPLEALTVLHPNPEVRRRADPVYLNTAALPETSNFSRAPHGSFQKIRPRFFDRDGFRTIP